MLKIIANPAFGPGRVTDAIACDRRERHTSKGATMRYVILLFLTFVLSACDSRNNQRDAAGPGVDQSDQASMSKSASSDGYIPFPDGYGYMEDIPALQKAVDNGDRQAIRRHAWKLWAGIMQPAEESGWPLWYTWPNTKAAFSASQPKSVDQPSSGDAPGTTIGSSESLRAKNRKNIPDVDTPSPTYEIPKAVIRDYPGGICRQGGSVTICDGEHFLFNGDIMIPTESLSREAMNSIRGDKLYLASTLDALHQQDVHELDVTQRFIVTKHMYWPVKADGITGVPVWKNNFPPTFTGYAGYEKWDTLIGIDPGGEAVGQEREVAYLYGVKNHAGTKELKTVKATARVYGLEDFYYHKITKEDWASFDEADKAILNASSYWANNQAIDVGDYLVTIAMHVNTKELPSWTLQSVWWSDEPGKGKYAADRPALPQAKGPWDHYLLTDSYVVPPNEKGELDIAVNPYIEGVIHPIATSCRNCHVRAGWPTGRKAGTASYQNPDCPELLGYLTPSSKCLEKMTLTDYLWIIPDRAVSD